VLEIVRKPRYFCESEDMRANVPSRLAEELKTIRIMRKLSLRVVEKKTGISNAYLSQLERGEAENPAPDKLQKLAQCYGVSYEYLMKAAGYLKAATGKESRPDLSRLQTALMAANLTNEEEERVLEYLRFLRFAK
jgi:transcriptional regulator with XRE-family HTH domain